jgi:hypothetical protein
MDCHPAAGVGAPEAGFGGTMGRRKSRLPKLIACAMLGVGVWAIAGAPRGCDRSATRVGSNKAIVLNSTTRSSSPASRTAVAPPPPAALTQAPPASKPVLTGGGAATSKPAEKPQSQMLINGVLVNFPEAKLLVRKEGDKLSAFLVSNDPPEVINPTYEGNRYYFEMALDAVDDVKNLADAEFRYKAPTAESQETPNGVFLDGDRQHLEPYDIQVLFDRDGDHMVAEIRGQFMYFPKGGAVGQMVPVVAKLAAKPETK